MQKKKTGRIGCARAKINLDVVDALSAYQFSTAEIASYCGVSTSTIDRLRAENKIQGRVDFGRLNGKVSARRMLYSAAKTGNIAAILYLAKTVGEIREVNSIEVSGPNGGPVGVASMPALDLSALSDDEIERLQELVGKAKPKAISD